MIASEEIFYMKALEQDAYGKVIGVKNGVVFMRLACLSMLHLHNPLASRYPSSISETFAPWTLAPSLLSLDFISWCWKQLGFVTMLHSGMKWHGIRLEIWSKKLLAIILDQVRVHDPLLYNVPNERKNTHVLTFSGRAYLHGGE